MRGTIGGMKDAAQSKGRRRLIAAAYAFAALLPVFYVLSIGPYAGLYWRGYVSESAHGTLQDVYSPVFWLAKKSRKTQAALDWYLDLLGP